ncbi:calpain-B [Asbolus verrucosus]|uniref:Calpain-B n=1 Tax=Asbolus verrucosus TaxID=1661398 RepID=A0A482W9G6_ASBVE|nr:calpain-B [Asbolus verrucosus]
MAEANITKKSAPKVSQINFKFSKHSVAPSEYKAAYNKSVYPRSVLNDGNADTEIVSQQPFIVRLKDITEQNHKEVKRSTIDTLCRAPVEVGQKKKIVEELQSGLGLTGVKPSTDLTAKAAEGYVFRNSIKKKTFKEIVSNPQLFVEGFSRFDVQQGELGDCWLLAAVANLTLYRRLFFQIVPDDQGFDEDYAGIFHFRLHGSYEALKGGSTCEAMEDFTGGVTEMYEMNASPPNLFKIIVKAYERWSLMGCSIEPDPDVLEAQTPEGLIRGHAYSITKVQYVNIRTPNVSGKIPLLRLRNPWGNESEWNGAWGDHAPEWQYISDAQKEELGLNFDADGEFWMSFKDFQTHFHRLEICNLNPDSLSEDELTEGRNKKWVMSVFEGEWVRGVTAGGCRNFLDTFWHNPQYRVTLDEADEEDEEDKCTMIVALMQKNRRQLRSTGGIDLLTIGFAIYHLPYPDRVPKPLNLDFFKYNASVARSPSFINLREVSCRFKLPRGTYCIVPSTFDPNDEGEFLLRVFSEHQNNMEYDGSYSDNLHTSITENETNDDNDDRRPQNPYYNNPSGPYPSAPHTPSSPYPSTPSSPYPNPYSSNPYPPNPYPYPQTSYGQENDQEVGLRDIDHKADSMKLTPDDIKENDLIMELFKKIVGKDNEVDWKELQEILNYYTRKELFSEDEPSLRAQNVDGVGAVRGQGQEQQSSNENNLLTAILALLCGVLCKNTPLADAIPAPTQELPLNDAYYAA